MVAGRPPFHGENHIDLLRNIQRRAVRLPPGVQITPECINLLRILLNRNPTRRATFQNFLEASREFVKLGCNGPIAATLDSLSGVQSTGPMSSRPSIQTAPLALISEESPLGESLNGDDGTEEKVSPQNLQLAKQTTLSMLTSRSNLQVTADCDKIIPNDLAKAVSTKTGCNLFQQSGFPMPGSLPLTRHHNQAISHLLPLVAR